MLQLKELGSHQEQHKTKVKELLLSFVLSRADGGIKVIKIIVIMC